MNRMDVLNQLPIELQYEILGFLSPLDILFSTRFIWPKISISILFKYYKNQTSLLERLKISDHVFNRKRDALECFNEFLSHEDVKSRTKFFMFAFKYEIYQFSKQVYKNRTVLYKGDEGFCNDSKWVEDEISYYNGLFENAKKNCKQMKNEALQAKEIENPIVVANSENEKNSQGFFSIIYNFFSSFRNSSETKVESTRATGGFTPIHTHSQDYDYLIKIYIEGCGLSGKTTFFNCITNNSPQPSLSMIWIDFLVKEYKLGARYKSKIQLWDSAGRERFAAIARAYYRGCFMICLLVDPYDDWNLKGMEGKIEHIHANAQPGTQVVIVTTKRDLESEEHCKLLTNDQADYLAYKEFNSLHLDITSMEIEEPQTIALYSVILRYVTKTED